MLHLNDDKIKFLEAKANDIRQSIIEMLMEAKSGHTAGPLGMADIFTLLYFHALEHDPKKSGMAGKGQIDFVQRAHLPGALRGDGTRWLFPD